MDLFSESEQLYSIFDDYSTSSSSEISPEHYTNFFSPSQPEENSWTLDMTNLHNSTRAPQITPTTRTIDKKKKPTKKADVSDAEIEKFLKKPDFFANDEEEREWKKQKRMIRNRLSAQASREKRRDELEYFKTLNSGLTNKNEELSRKMQDLQYQNDQLVQENLILRSKIREYEPNYQFGGLNSVPKKTLIVFTFLFCVGFFFTFGMSNGKSIEGLSNHVGRVLLSVNQSSSVQKNVAPPVQPEWKFNSNLEMKKESVLFQSELKNLFVPETNFSTSKDLVEVDPTQTQLKPKMEKGFIFHYKNDQDTILFMCPKLYPIFPTTTTAGKNLSMTFLIPVESTKENDQTIVKLSKFTATEIEKSEAYLTL